MSTKFTQETENIFFPDQVEPVYDPTDPISDYQFKEYWKKEKDRCMNGFYLADGKVFIPGELYNHCVYWKIAAYITNDKTGKKSRKVITPVLRDIEWLIFNDIHTCREEGKFYALVGSRDFGKSIIAGSLAGHNYTFFDNSESVISGGESSYIKLATDKIEVGLTNYHPIFKKNRLGSDWKKEVRAGWKDKSTNQPSEKSSNSAIIIRNYEMGTKTMAANGTRPGFHLIDEIGTIPNLIACVKDSDGCWWSGDGDKPSCLVMYAGTGGDMEVGQDASTIFYSPDVFNLLEFDDPERPGKKIGRFISALQAKMAYKEPMKLSQYLGIDHPDLDRITIMVSNEERALKEWWQPQHEKAKKGGAKTLTKFLAYWPLKPSDSFLTVNQNNFNIHAAKAQQARLRDNNIRGSSVEIKSDGEKLIHEFIDKMPIDEWPIKSMDRDGCVVMYEAPIPNAPKGLYVAGCLLPGEKVLTDQGLKDVEEVDLKNKLINKDAELVEIINLQRYYKNDTDVYTVKVANTIRKTTFTGEHPLYIQKQVINKYGRFDPVNQDNFNFLQVEDVNKGDWIKVPNIYCNESDFDIDNLWEDEGRIDFRNSSPLKDKDFWWLVGLFLGDGWILSDKSGNIKIQFSINIKENYYVDRLRSIVKRLFKRSLSVRRRDGVYECSFTCKALGKFLNKYFGKYACCKTIPEWVKRTKHEFKSNLILGYLDSDGCVVYDKNRNLYTLDFVSINLELIEHIQDILFSIGIVSNANILRKSTSRKFSNAKKESQVKETYQLRVGNSGSVFFRKLFSSPVGKLLKIDLNTCNNLPKPPKRCFMSKDNKYLFFQITEVIKSKYTGWVFNFECDTHTYLCKNITTHNCDPYKQDRAKYSDSLGSVYIFKRIHDITSEKYQDMFVAQYVGRPESMTTWYETARNLIKYYNATALVENEDYGFIQYMLSKHEGHFLADQPTWLREIIPNSTVNRQKGIHASPKIINHINGLLKEYTEEVVNTVRDENGTIIKEVIGMTKILDPMLLEEIIKFNAEDNFDRVRAAALAVAMARHLDPIYKITSEEQDPRYKSYFERNKDKSHTLFKESPKIFSKKGSRIKRLFH